MIGLTSFVPNRAFESIPLLRLGLTRTLWVPNQHASSRGPSDSFTETRIGKTGHFSFVSSRLRYNPRMWESRSVQLNVSLPRDLAAQAEEVQESDPDFLSRIVLYGLTRRSIYRHLRTEETAEQSNDPTPTEGSVATPVM